MKEKHTGKGEMYESHIGEGDKTEQTTEFGGKNLTTLMMVISAATEVTDGKQSVLLENDSFTRYLFFSLYEITNF